MYRVSDNGWMNTQVFHQWFEICSHFAVKSPTELLNERVNVLGPKESISKSTFFDLLSQVWYKVLSETNIISEFRATEIFPTNRDNCNI